ncbi:hypothetical protein C8R45DRAFT_473370, partial [Mycena sanguinolenta]
PRLGHDPVPPALFDCDIVDLSSPKSERRVRGCKSRRARKRREREREKRMHRKLLLRMREWKEHWAQERENEERQHQEREKEERERLEREQEEQWERDQRKREREEQERQEHGRLQRRIQLTQMLEAPPEGRLLTLLSSFIFIMLAVLALELIGWFIFLGLLVTILAYLLLIILFVGSPNVSPWEIQRGSLRSSSSNLARVTLAEHWYCRY